LGLEEVIGLATIIISGHVEKDTALEFKARLPEHGQISQAIRKFVKVYVMMARESQEEVDVVIDAAAVKAATDLLNGGF